MLTHVLYTHAHFKRILTAVRQMYTSLLCPVFPSTSALILSLTPFSFSMSPDNLDFYYTEIIEAT